MTNKPRVLKAFEALDQEIQEQIKLAYPEGFKDYLIKFMNKDGVYQSGLPFETEDKYYLVKMTAAEAKELIADDDDYDDDGNLRDEVREEYEDRYDDEDGDDDFD